MSPAERERRFLGATTKAAACRAGGHRPESDVVVGGDTIFNPRRGTYASSHRTRGVDRAQWIAGPRAVALPATAQRGRGGGDSTTGRGLPFTPTHALKFTTDEGTWLSLDLSPDGNSIVFELLGDLYTLPVSGGKATRITSGQAYDAMPHYSPDGKEVVFVSDRSGSDNVWLANADGTNPRQITRDNNNTHFQSPTFTPDGKYIIVSQGNDLQMYFAHGGTGGFPPHR